MMIDKNLITNFSIEQYIRVNYFSSLMEKYNFTFVGEGFTRRTYLSPNERFILKCPINEDGLYCNIRESELWHKFKSRANKSGIYFIPCRLINNCILMMWAVNQIAGDSIGDRRALDDGNLYKMDKSLFQDWFHNIDSCQVGLYNGKPMAYDYGDIPL